MRGESRGGKPATAHAARTAVPHDTANP